MSQTRSLGLVIAAAVALLLIALLMRPSRKEGVSTADSVDPLQMQAAPNQAGPLRFQAESSSSIRSGNPPTRTPESIVAAKLTQFAGIRLEMARAIANRSGKELPPEIEKFFAFFESGDLESVKAQFELWSRQRGQASPEIRALVPYWSILLDTYGVAEQARTWPAQKLLDYGNAILSSLRPGMVYLGGTDPGRWIPELLNETSGSEPHVILTQNAFADGEYLEFITSQYSNRLATLNSQELGRSYMDYNSDAQQRYQHDQQFPNEPKQVRAGERIVAGGGQVQVSGVGAVMTINENLLQALLAKNPDVSFAMEQSFPMKSIYSNAAPLGAVIELRVQNAQDTLTSERAKLVVEYWRTMTDRLQADFQMTDSVEGRRAYSKLAVNQAALLVNCGFAAEAEQTFRLATDISPTNPEAVWGLAELLVGQKTPENAIPVVEAALKADPENSSFRFFLGELQKKRN